MTADRAALKTLGTVPRGRILARTNLGTPLLLTTEHDVLAGSDCVIASTPAEAEDLLQHYGADPTRLCISPPGVDHDVFSPGDRRLQRAELGLPEDDPLVLFVGRVQPLKGIDVAVEAFALLRRQHPAARLVVVGGPSGPSGSGELQNARDVADKAGATEVVSFLHPVEHSVLARYYRAADVLLVPSRSESFGLVAVEAQASGLPVVAARVGGLAYAVADGQSGFLIDGWDPADYAEAAGAILLDSELAGRLGKGGIEHADRGIPSFSLSRYAVRNVSASATFADTADGSSTPTVSHGMPQPTGSLSSMTGLPPSESATLEVVGLPAMGSIRLVCIAKKRLEKLVDNPLCTRPCGNLWILWITVAARRIYNI